MGLLDAPTDSKAWQMAETLGGAEGREEFSVDLEAGQARMVCGWEEKVR